MLRPEPGTAATLGFVLRYLGLFSDSFTLAIILWPFASAVLTLPILAMLYHKDHRLRLGAGLSAYLAVLYALGLVAFTLYPMPDDPVRFCATHHLLPQLDLLKFIQDAQTGLYGVLQLVMNVVFFMPMGFMLCRWAGWRFWVALPFSFGCSVFIETSQLTGFWGLYPCAYRQFDVDDMLTNTLGAVIGFGIAKLIGLVWPKKQIEAGGVVTRPGFVHRAVALIIDVILMQICVFTISIAFMYAFYKLALPLNNGRFTIGAFEVGTELVEWVPRLLAVRRVRSVGPVAPSRSDARLPIHADDRGSRAARGHIPRGVLRDAHRGAGHVVPAARGRRESAVLVVHACTAGLLARREAHAVGHDPRVRR